jgi:hypothetical protein
MQQEKYSKLLLLALLCLHCQESKLVSERESVWAAVGSGLVFCVRVVLGVFSCSRKIFESIVTFSFVFIN